MMIPIESLPDTTRLYRDYISDFARLSAFFDGDYRDQNAYRQKAEQVFNASHPVKELVSILDAQNRAWGCSEKTLENIARLQHDKALAVVTGQQVGLFTGPLYTIYKALTTIKFADHLTQMLSTPVVPVFYLVSEDHDFNEVQWAGYVDQQNMYKKAVYSSQTDERKPVYKFILNETIKSTVAEMAASLPSTEFKEDIFASLAKCYAPGKSFVDAFACWFTKIFSSFGVVILDSSDVRLKCLIKTVFEKELANQITEKEISITMQKLEALGYHSQLSVQKGRPAVFILEDGRHSLEKTSDGFRNLHSGQIFGQEELVRNCQKLSPKAALRTIAQDSLLPTIAYVGGPGEIAYWGQLKSVYQAFDLPMPIVIPRAGFTLLEAKIKRHLEKFRLDVRDLFADREKAFKSALKSLMPADLDQQIQTSRQKIASEFGLLAQKMLAIEPTLESALEKTESNVASQLGIMEQKVVRAIRDREKIVAQQLETISHNIFPDDSLQERKLNILPFLVRHNWSIIQKIYEEIGITEFEHKILEL